RWPLVHHDHAVDHGRSSRGHELVRRAPRRGSADRHRTRRPARSGVRAIGHLVVATRARARRAIIARAPWARRHAHGPHEPPHPERPPKFSTRFRAHSGTPKPITHRAKLRFRHRTDNGKPSHAVRTAFDPPYTCE